MIHVFARHAETRLFDVNALNLHRSWQRTLGTGDGTTLASSSGGRDPLDDIEKGVESLLSPSGRAHLDRRSGLVQVTDDADRLDHVALYLEALQIRASRQVRLQGRVLEVRLGDRASIDWRAVRQKLGLAPVSAEAGITGDLEAIQDALALQGEIRVLATPDVIAMNNEPAVLRAGTPDVSWLMLTVIPQISPEGIVQLGVSPSWSERAGTRQENGHFVATMHVAEVDTVARVTDGRTVLLAGLLGTAEATKPAGGFGAVFGAPAKQTLHTELVVLLTPTVVTPAAIAAGSR
jgi:type II secretory pathway component GspD/PulD (secretin)